MYHRGMKRCLFFILLFFSLQLGAATTLKDKLIQAKVGDYVVTSQGNHYSMLIVKSVIPTEFVLEEITIPTSSIDPKKTIWKEWAKKRAPGHTAWISYTFDLEKNTLTRCFSITQKQNLFIDPSDQILAKLIALPLKPTLETERKRIGPPPMEGETDRRKFWLPPLVRAGQKMKEAHFEIVKTRWPDDKSRMAGCDVELYLDADHPEFPFPYWIEIQGSHYTYKMQTIDSGSLYTQVT